MLSTPLLPFPGLTRMNSKTSEQSSERPLLGRIEVTANARTMEIDARVIGAGLGLEPAQVQALMQSEKISLLCERGTSEDQGCHRITFYYSGRRFRILIDPAGHIFETT